MELAWNAAGEVCEPCTFEDLLALSNAISNHVKPFVQLQRETEVFIRECKSENEVCAVVEEYVATLSGLGYQRS